MYSLFIQNYFKRKKDRLICLAKLFSKSLGKNKIFKSQSPKHDRGQPSDENVTGGRDGNALDSEARNPASGQACSVPAFSSVRSASNPPQGLFQLFNSQFPRAQVSNGHT